MLQLFSVLALLLASADRPQKGVEITAENGRVVVPSGDSCFRAQKLTFPVKDLPSSNKCCEALSHPGPGHTRGDIVLKSRFSFFPPWLNPQTRLAAIRQGQLRTASRNDLFRTLLRRSFGFPSFGNTLP